MGRYGVPEGREGRGGELVNVVASLRVESLRGEECESWRVPVGLEGGERRLEEQVGDEPRCGSVLEGYEEGVGAGAGGKVVRIWGVGGLLQLLAWSAGSPGTTATTTASEGGKPPRRRVRMRMRRR